MCYNYKGFFSLVLMAICDSDYKFVLIDVGTYGRFGDSAIFQNSNFYKKIQEKRLNIPDPSPILPDSTTCLPFVFVGDEAFALINDIIKSACLLHNFVRDRDSFSFEDTLNNPLTETIASDSVRRNNRTALRYRELFAEYFMTEGRLDWQDNYI
ncbi:hypothetical protein QTP88_010043 [Uroleucon formosanum]